MLIGPLHRHKFSLNYPIGQLGDFLLLLYSRQVLYIFYSKKAHAEIVLQDRRETNHCMFLLFESSFAVELQSPKKWIIMLSIRKWYEKPPMQQMH